MEKETLEVENPWIKNRKYKPDCNDRMFVRDYDGDYHVARYNYDQKLWFDWDDQVVNVQYWMEIPPIED